MKFFLPVQETKVAEESYQAIKKFIEKQTGWPVSDKRYYVTKTYTFVSEDLIR